MDTERQCRLCFETDERTRFLSPCRCRGTQAYIHAHCLALYIRHYPDGICRVCRTPFVDVQNDDKLYCAATIAWMIALIHASTLSYDPRGMYLTLVAGTISYCLSSRGLPLRFVVLGMLLSASFLLTSVQTLVWLLGGITGLLTAMVLWMYIPSVYLLLGFAILASALYSVFLLVFALLRTESTFAALLVCILGTVWYLMIRARPPLRIV